MATILNRTQTFATNGTVTAAGLHNLIDDTGIYAGLITTQTELTTVGTADQLLIAVGGVSDTGAPRRATVQNLFDDALSVGTYTGLNLTGALTYGTATGNRTVSTSATITTGTIPNLTSGTTTSTAATITSGTITNLASTTGTIATLNSTTGTIPTLVATTLVTTGTGTAAAPAIVPTGDTNTGIFFPAADTIAFAEGGAEAMRIDSSGNVLVNTTVNDTGGKLEVKQAAAGIGVGIQSQGNDNAKLYFRLASGSTGVGGELTSNGGFVFTSGTTENMRITGDGALCIGRTTYNLDSDAGVCFQNGSGVFTANGGSPIFANRKGNDGIIIGLYQDATLEGNISVSGNTVSYNPFAGSHWSQLEDGSRPEILRGTVIESINQLCQWPDGGNERFAKCKISDTIASNKVYGVFLDWDNDWTQTNDLYVTAVGLFVCRINASVTVQIGDLLESNGDGTARVQADNVIRSSTIGKVTSSIKTHEYQDGSYCVPTVLYCG